MVPTVAIFEAFIGTRIMAVQAAGTALIAELTLSWINEQLREEVSRREAVAEPPRPLFAQYLPVVSVAAPYFLAGLCWVFAAGLA